MYFNINFKTKYENKYKTHFKFPFYAGKLISVVIIYIVIIVRLFSL